MQQCQSPVCHLHYLSLALNILLVFEDGPSEGGYYLHESIYIIHAGWSVERSQFSSQSVLMTEQYYPQHATRLICSMLSFKWHVI